MTHTISNIIDLTNAPTPPRWFEFLLEPGRLQHHLETNGCDPSPTQLITLFFRNIPILDSSNNHSLSQRNSTCPAPTNGNSTPPSGLSNEDSKSFGETSDRVLIDFSDATEVQIPPDSYEAKYRIKKAYALQTLALKVASFLKWDLDIICANLTIPVQYKLMSALSGACSSTNCPEPVRKFAEVIYSHWFLRSSITYQLSTLQPQSNNTTIIYLSQLQQQQQAADSTALSSMGELFSVTSKQLRSCLSALQTFIRDLSQDEDGVMKKLRGSNYPLGDAQLSRPTMNCFDSRDEQYNKWDQCESVESKEFIDAACYDLGRFFFFEENYDMAKRTFEFIKESSDRFPKLIEYHKSASDIVDSVPNGKEGDMFECDSWNKAEEKRKQTEKYLFDCMTQFSKIQKKEIVLDGSDKNGDCNLGEDSDLRFNHPNQQKLPSNSTWYIQAPVLAQQQQLIEAAKGDVSMSQGNFKQAMGCFVGALMLQTDYFRFFSKNYADEEPYISRMIQCSISLCCFTQAVALCQMTRSLNYTIAFKQLNERVCNDCCDDIYECIWNVTLLEYIINLHSKRGEVERRTRVIQLIGQLELNENNPEEILKEAEHVRRSRFFRIMSNKYL